MNIEKPVYHDAVAESGAAGSWADKGLTEIPGGNVEPLQCFAFSSNSYNGFGPSMTFQEVLTSFQREGLGVSAFSPRLRRKPQNTVKQVQGLPPGLRMLPWRFVGNLGVELTEKKFLSALLGHGDRNNVFAYSFPDLSVSGAKRIRDAGIPLVREMIGVHRRTARRVMVEEHQREGLAPFDAISESSVREEDEWLKNATAILAPNEQVFESLVESGFSEKRILRTSYGWSPTRFPLAETARTYDDGLRLLFVGRVSYAKGAHLLLRAWQQAGHPGKLILAGKIEAALEARMADVLNHPSVQKLGFIHDLSPVYAAANAFALPTLFEGGPQVTLEAAAHGLALLVSPMGSARLVHDGVEGRVIEPHSADEWAQAISDLASDASMSERWGTNARSRANDFRWDIVSRNRALAIKAFLNGRDHGSRQV